ncbi:NAD dependent epimerase/dehydratase family protein [Sclerotinia borealis F-4128]|uniref:NAD dependent epimerase/dehydratase family protein n=1 Tax=Sclerotinia borealis (strain F-4128) TaxID=1432307 RepID=W9CWS4_SCLBF|nr:NAD dependent epimerase/dehydratase family protein [Sclerotinia borealis F-4128]
MASTKILFTGATGYVGGSILSTILQQDADFLSKYSLSVLMRKEEQARVFSAQGVNTILFSSLDDTEFLQKVAREHDVIINAAFGPHTAAAVAFVTGLGDRKKQTGKEVHYLHISGTSTMSDQPLSGAFLEDRIFSDTEDIFSYEKYRESKTNYPLRTTDVALTEAGLLLGVNTTIIMPPEIHGTGSGLFNANSIQAPAVVRHALKHGQAAYIGDGKGIWDYVHVSDVANLFEIVISKILRGEEVPTGTRGIIFSSAGRFTWQQFSEYAGEALFKRGAISIKEAKSITLEEAGDWYGGSAYYVELAFASNSRTNADVARDLGWVPKKT